MRVSLASSWKNERLVKDLATILRDAGKQEVYCFAEAGAGQHIFDWSDIISMEDDGITCLQNWNSKKAYGIDMAGLNWANVCILVNPCGRDAHLEGGYAKGQGKYLIVLGSFPKGEFSNMYHLADRLYKWEQLAQMIRFLQELDSGETTT